MVMTMYILDKKNKLIRISEKEFNDMTTKLILNYNISIEEEQKILDYEIQSTLDELSQTFGVDAYNSPLENKCDYVQRVLGKKLEKLNITVYPKETKKIITSTVPGHSFLIVKMPQKIYLVDPTFCQFLQTEKCISNNFLIYENMILKAPDPGYFIIKTLEGQNVASELLNKRYIELNETVAKIYCDSFYYAKQGTIIQNNKIPNSNIDGEIYLNTLLKEEKIYSVSDEKFNELYSRARK